MVSPLKKTSLINALQNLNQVVIQIFVSDIFVLFEPPESAHPFREFMSFEHQNINFTVEQKILAHFCFKMLIVVVKTVYLSLVSPIMKVLLQRTKREEFYIAS